MSTRQLVVWGVLIAMALLLVIVGLALGSAPLVLGGAILGLGTGFAARSFLLGRVGGRGPDDPPQP